MSTPENSNTLKAALEAVKANPRLAIDGLRASLRPETAALITGSLCVQHFGRGGEILKPEIGDDPMVIFDDLRSHFGAEAAALITAALWARLFHEDGDLPVLY